MGKSKKKAKKKRTAARRTTSLESRVPAESKTAVAATVAWTLALMSTLAAEALGLACRWYTTLVEPVDLLTVLSMVMLFVATIGGLVTLCLTPVIFRVAKTHPPRAVVHVAVIAGSLPILVVLLKSAFGT